MSDGFLSLISASTVLPVSPQGSLYATAIQREQKFVFHCKLWLTSLIALATKLFSSSNFKSKSIENFTKVLCLSTDSWEP